MKTYSEVRCWKECRRKYEFAYVEKIVPVSTPKPMKWGSAVHAGLEAYFKGEDSMQAIKDCYKDEYDFVEMNKALACLSVFAFPYKVWDTETIFQTDISQGKIDGKCEYMGETFLLEHKTTSKNLEQFQFELNFDEQSSSYLYANPDCKGVVYNIIQKCQLRQKKTETEEEFVERVAEWYEEGERFHIHVVRRTVAQIEEWREQFVEIAREIDRCHCYYRNPSHCTMGFASCSYSSICLNYHPDVVDGVFFRRKEKKNEEL